MSSDDAAKEDLKILKKYARRCNQQNKLFQKLVGDIDILLNGSESISVLDLENLTEESVESFMLHVKQKWQAGHAEYLMDRKESQIAAIDRDDESQALRDSISKLQDDYQALREELSLKDVELRSTLEQLQKQDLEIDELKTTLDNYKYSKQKRSGSFKSVENPNCDSEDQLPLRSLHDLKLTKKEFPSVYTATNTVDDFMALLEGVASAASSSGGASTGIKNSFSVDSEYGGKPEMEEEQQLDLSDFIETVEASLKVGILSDSNATDEKKISVSLLSFPDKSVDEKVTTISSNPFDDDEELVPQAAMNPFAEATESVEMTREPEFESAVQKNDQVNRTRLLSAASSDGESAWTEYTETHLCPPYGLKSPVVEHLLHSWTSDERKVQYLVSWIECLASPLPKQFPPGLQIVRVSCVVRDGFLILLLPIIRHISMHEINAFLKPSNPNNAESQSIDGLRHQSSEELFDVRFQVIRVDIPSNEGESQEHGESAIPEANWEGNDKDQFAPCLPADSKKSVLTAIQKKQEHVPDSGSTEAGTEVPPQSVLSGVFQSIPLPSFSSYLNPISSFWSGSSASTVTSNKPVLIPEGVTSRDGEGSSQSPPQQSVIGPANYNPQDTSSGDINHLPHHNDPTTSPSLVDSKKTGPPPANRIAARLATLRNK